MVTTRILQSFSLTSFTMIAPVALTTSITEISR
jgi:hypothetical protein